MSHGSHAANPREAPRPSHEVDPSRWVRRYLAPHLGPGMRVLDVGCGSGEVAAEVARRFPDADVVALDAGDARLSLVRRNLSAHQHASAVAGDPDDLPFEAAGFDLVYCRLALAYLPHRRRAVAELARVCRSGGTVLVQGVDGRFVDHYPHDAELQRGLGKALALLAAAGFDPHVGRKLRSLLQQAGLTPAGLRVEQYDLIAGSVGVRERGRWLATLGIAADSLTRLGFRDADLLADRFLDYLDRDDTITFSSLFTAWARKP